MSDVIRAFINQKNLSKNSQDAYASDLEQFLGVLGDDGISSRGLEAYQVFLKPLKPSAQKRKRSAVNQFLYYLYQEKIVADFHKLGVLSSPSYASQEVAIPQLEDWSMAYHSAQATNGQLILLLILELGLLPSDILKVKNEDIDLNFRVLSLRQGQLLRIIPLPECLIPYLEKQMVGTYLFDHKGKAYTRQWLFNQLNHYLVEFGRPEMTAQKLREQFILKEVARGTSILDLAKRLGLKTTVTLEKYYQSNGY